MKDTETILEFITCIAEHTTASNGFITGILKSLMRNASLTLDEKFETWPQMNMITIRRRTPHQDLISPGVSFLWVSTLRSKLFLPLSASNQPAINNSIPKTRNP